MLGLLTMWAFAAAVGAEDAISVEPREPRAGDIIVLAIAGKPAAKVAWTAFPRLAGERKTILADGSKAYLASVPGRYTIVAAIADPAGKEADGLSIRLVERQVVVSSDLPPGPGPGPQPNPGPSPGPGPAPGPDPGPTPQPPGPGPGPPAGKFGLGKHAFEQAGQLSAAAKAKAPAVAAAFRSLVDQLPKLFVWQIAGETTKAVDAAIGDQKPAWAAASKALQTTLRELAKAGKIKDIADLAEAYREIAGGLDAVK